MNHIAVIGAGQLGSRHLQGLASLAVPTTLYMVDPVQDSLDRARQRFQEMPANGNVTALHAIRNVEELPDRVDLAIVATTAEVRLMLLERLFSQRMVRNVVLEKVLFQREEEYARAGQLLADNGAKAWVNCPRRIFPIYSRVRDFFQQDPVQSMQVHGGDWGLGCNCVHFADLFCFLAGTVVEEFDTRLVDKGFYAGKREGFVEFGGTLIGKAGKASLWMTAVNGSAARHLITVRGEKLTCVIDEVGGQAWFIDDDGRWRSEAFNLPYQSQMTGTVAMAILAGDDCGLPTYLSSAKVHLPLVRSLHAHLLQSGVDTSCCPIT
jgi:Predicted dehydrogenases and related proteins